MEITEIFETMEYSPAPESPDLALEWLKEHKSKFGLFINGKWCKASPAKFSAQTIRQMEKNWPLFLKQEKVT